LNVEQQEATLNQLLKEALETGISFEPNKVGLGPEAQLAVRQIAFVLKHFPRWAIRCEGHTKGRPADNNDAKRQLSQVRAEALRAAVEARGVFNSISCIGQGCSQGLGMCVRMVAVELDTDVVMPDLSGLPREAQEERVNALLAKALERNIDFEPNKCELPPSSVATIRAVGRVLKGFPDFIIRCEGHAKGKPDDDNDAKRKLSQSRAEAVRIAVLQEEGVSNVIYAVGEGSRQGFGMCVRMLVTEPVKEFEIAIPEMSDLSTEERTKVADELLQTVLERTIEFEPNSSEIPLSGMGTIRNIARVLQAVPDLAFRCAGHTKGLPGDNNDAKRKLSNARAEAVKAAVLKEGALNTIHCVGEGSALGKGMCVRIASMSADELKQFEVNIPETGALSLEERGKVLNELLAKALTKTISFEPNRADIQASAMGTVSTIARLLKAFPEFPVRCEGHTKGKPAENSEARMRLSQVRAEAVRTALQKEGVTSEIICVGQGSAQGRGMCVLMFTPDAPQSPAVG
jgi:outer membrane protein OmpA-like peptidoglycan-associated protein